MADTCFRYTGLVIKNVANIVTVLKAKDVKLGKSIPRWVSFR